MIIIMFRIVFVSKYEKSCQHLMDNCHFSKCRLMIFTTFLNIGRWPGVSSLQVSACPLPGTVGPSRDVQGRPGLPPTTTSTRDRLEDPAIVTSRTDWRQVKLVFI